MKSLGLVVVAAVFVLAASPAIFSQDDKDFLNAKALSIPKVKIPSEAVATGLGGDVNVRVKIDEAGKVIKVEDVFGPGWVCPSVKRVDVLAIRTVASTAAENSVFAPATRNGKPVKSSMWIGFIFPEKKPPSQGVANHNEEAPGSSAQGKPKEIVGGVVNGKALKLPAPKFPAQARDAGASGKVDIKVYIIENGSVFSAEPISGHILLQPAARLSACMSKFSPTRLSGKAVIVIGVISYNFIL